METRQTERPSTFAYVPPFHFTLVGMRFDGVTAAEAANFKYLVLLDEPDNEHDKRAIRVYGFVDRFTNPIKIGYVSRDTHPLNSIHPIHHNTIPAHKDGTIYKVYSSEIEVPTAVNFALYVDKIIPFQWFIDLPERRKRVQSGGAN